MPRRKSSVVGREFGEGVRYAIEQTGMTHRKLAEELGWDEAKLSDLVRGKGGVDESDLKQLLGYCRVKPAEARHLLALFRETRETGYLEIPEDGQPDQVRILIDQERLANEITVWSMNLIPGQLQTADYMRALSERGVRDASVDYEERIAARMAQRSYITVRVVPTALGAHAGVAGSFLRFGYEKYEPVIFIESKNSCLFLEDKGSLDVYGKILKLLDQQALSAQDSKELITGILH